MSAVPVNYLAILVSAIAVIVVSMLWYGPLFGKTWMKLAGMGEMTPDMMEKGKKEMPKNSFIQFVFALLMGWVLAHAIVFANAYLGTTGILSGLMAGLMNWLGFVAPVSIGMVLWEGRKWSYWFIVAGNWLVNLLVIGAILGVWM